MMKLVNAYNNFFQRYFPSPLSIAILLSVLSFLLAFVFTQGTGSYASYIGELAGYWFEGVFKSSLLEFTVHMMLILVLGHVIALSKPAKRVIDFVLSYCTNTARSALLVSLLTILVSFFNWGFALIFGAIFARKVGEKFQREQRVLNYPLVAVAAYVGMMVWHGGLSGSAPLTVAGAAHTYVNEIGVIGLEKTIFSQLNIFNSILIVAVVPMFFYFIGKKGISESIPKIHFLNEKVNKDSAYSLPAERLENSSLVGGLFGGVLILYFIFLSWQKVSMGLSFLSLLNLQSTNLLLLGLAFFLQGSIRNFLGAVSEAIGDVSGILIQFPLYFGIMGIIQGSGLAGLIANMFTQLSNDVTLPIFTFLSAGILNVFVPSGGGQWQIQAPIIIESAAKSGVEIQKLIMAMSYGDQLTNMLQPFWALPLLGITQLSAKDILPYCLLVFLVGFSIFTLTLLVF
ncbi:MAG: short-chain fatty acids transporter [Chitinophagales bacterium]|jgi:short-chain fatty acids transporter